MLSGIRLRKPANKYMSKQSYKESKSNGLFSNSKSKSAKAEPPEGFLEMVADRFKVLGEPMRLRLIHTLMNGESTVGSLVEKTGATQANVSRHLQTLTQAGILARRKDGLHVYYRIEDTSILDLCEHVCQGLRRQSEARAQIFG